MAGKAPAAGTADPNVGKDDAALYPTFYPLFYVLDRGSVTDEVGAAVIQSLQQFDFNNPVYVINREQIEGAGAGGAGKKVDPKAKGKDPKGAAPAAPAGAAATKDMRMATGDSGVGDDDGGMSDDIMEKLKSMIPQIVADQQADFIVKAKAKDAAENDRRLQEWEEEKAARVAMLAAALNKGSAKVDPKAPVAPAAPAKGGKPDPKAAGKPDAKAAAKGGKGGSRPQTPLDGDVNGGAGFASLAPPEEEMKLELLPPTSYPSSAPLHIIVCDMVKKGSDAVKLCTQGGIELCSVVMLKMVDPEEDDVATAGGFTGLPDDAKEFGLDAKNGTIRQQLLRPTTTKGDNAFGNTSGSMGAFNEINLDLLPRLTADMVGLSLADDNFRHLSIIPINVPKPIELPKMGKAIENKKKADPKAAAVPVAPVGKDAKGAKGGKAVPAAAAAAEEAAVEEEPKGLDLPTVVAMTTNEIRVALRAEAESKADFKQWTEDVSLVELPVGKPLETVDLRLYNNLLARTADMTVDTSLVLHCLFEQVAASASNVDFTSFYKNEVADELSNYLDEAMNRVVDSIHIDEDGEEQRVRASKESTNAFPRAEDEADEPSSFAVSVVAKVARHLFVDQVCVHCGEDEYEDIAEDPNAAALAAAAAVGQDDQDLYCRSTLGDVHKFDPFSQRCKNCGLREEDLLLLRKQREEAKAAAVAHARGDGAKDDEDEDKYCRGTAGGPCNFKAGICVQCGSPEDKEKEMKKKKSKAGLTGIKTSCRATIGGAHVFEYGVCKECGESEDFLNVAAMKNGEEEARMDGTDTIIINAGVSSSSSSSSSLATQPRQGAYTPVIRSRRVKNERTCQGSLNHPTNPCTTTILNAGDRNAFQLALASLAAQQPLMTSAVFIQAKKIVSEFSRLPGVNRLGFAGEDAKTLSQRGVEQTLLLNQSQLSADTFSHALMCLLMENMLAHPGADYTLTMDNPALHTDDLIDEVPTVEIRVREKLRELSKSGQLPKLGDGVDTLTEIIPNDEEEEEEDANLAHPDDWLNLRWNVANRTNCIEYDHYLLPQALRDAIFSVTDTTRTFLRYVPLDDSLFIVSHVPTPASRRSAINWGIVLSPNLSFNDWKRLEDTLRRRKPDELFRYHVPHSGRFRKNTQALFPADKARMGCTTMESGNTNWCTVWLEKDEHYFQIEDFSIPIQEPSLEDAQRDKDKDDKSGAVDKDDEKDAPADDASSAAGAAASSATQGSAATVASAGAGAGSDVGGDGKSVVGGAGTGSRESTLQSLAASLQDQAGIGGRSSGLNLATSVELQKAMANAASAAAKKALNGIYANFTGAYHTVRCFSGTFSDKSRIYASYMDDETASTGLFPQHGSVSQSFADEKVWQPTQYAKSAAEVAPPTEASASAPKLGYLKVAVTQTTGLVVTVREDASTYLQFPRSAIHTALTASTAFANGLSVQGASFPELSALSLNSGSGAPTANSGVGPVGEVSRCVNQHGVVIRMLVDGSKMFLYPDSSVRVQRGEGQPSLWTNAEGRRWLSAVGRDGQVVEMEAGRVDVNVRIDPELKAKIITRADFCQLIIYSNGCSLAMHADGTRIYRDIFVEQKKTVCNIECPTLPPVTVTQSEVATLIGDGIHSHGLKRTILVQVDVNMRDGTHIRRLPNGGVTVKKATGALVVCSPADPLESKPDGYEGNTTSTIVYVPETLRSGQIPSELHEGEIVTNSAIADMDTEENAAIINYDDLMIPNPNLVKNIYFWNMRSGKLETLDCEDNTFIASIVHRQAVANLLREQGLAGEDKKFRIPSKFFQDVDNMIAPRLFVVRSDGSGYEMLSADQVARFKRLIDNDPTSLVLPSEVVPEGQSLTMLSHLQEKREGQSTGNKEYFTNGGKVKLNQDGSTVGHSLESGEVADQGPLLTFRQNESAISQKFLTAVPSPVAYQRKPVIPNIIKASPAGGGENLITNSSNYGGAGLGGNSDGGVVEGQYKFVLYRQLIELPKLAHEDVLSVYKDLQHYREWKELQRKEDVVYTIGDARSDVEKQDQERVQLLVIAAREARKRKQQEYARMLTERKVDTLQDAQALNTTVLPPGGRIPDHDSPGDVNHTLLKKKAVNNGFTDWKTAREVAMNRVDTRDRGIPGEDTGYIESQAMGAAEKLYDGEEDDEQAQMQGDANGDGEDEDEEDGDEDLEESAGRLRKKAERRQGAIDSEVFETAMPVPFFSKATSTQQSSASSASSASDFQDIGVGSAIRKNYTSVPEFSAGYFSDSAPVANLGVYFNNVLFETKFKLSRCLQIICAQVHPLWTAPLPSDLEGQQGRVQQKLSKLTDRQRKDMEWELRRRAELLRRQTALLECSEAEANKHQQYWVKQVALVSEGLMSLVKNLMQVFDRPFDPSLRNINLREPPFEEVGDAHPVLRSHLTEVMQILGYQLRQDGSLVQAMDDSILHANTEILVEEAQGLVSSTRAAVHAGIAATAAGASSLEKLTGSSESSSAAAQKLAETRKYGPAADPSMGLDVVGEVHYTMANEWQAKDAARKRKEEKQRQKDEKRKRGLYVDDNDEGEEKEDDDDDLDLIPVSQYEHQLEMKEKAKAQRSKEYKEHVKKEHRLRQVASIRQEHEKRGESFLGKSPQEKAHEAQMLQERILAHPLSERPTHLHNNGGVDPLHVNVVGAKRTNPVLLPRHMQPSAAYELSNEYLGTKPGLKTTSTFMKGVVDPLAAGLPTFSLQPAQVHFGNNCKRGNTYRTTLELKNLGPGQGRFQVTEPRMKENSHNHLRVLWRPGPISSGLAKRLELEFYAGQAGPFSADVVVTTMKQKFKLPVSAYVVDGPGGMSVPSMSMKMHMQPEDARDDSRVLEPAYGSTSRPSTTRSNAERPFKVLGSSFKSTEEWNKLPHIAVGEQRHKQQQQQRQGVVERAGFGVAPLAKDSFGPTGKVRTVNDSKL